MRRLVFIILIFFAGPVWSSEHRRLESVELRQDDTGSWVELKTDRPANFTSFKLDAPPRVVVDFPETTAPATAREASTAGPVRGWTFKTWGDAASPVVRLTVELRDDADYTLTADGRRISLRLLPATGRPLVTLDGERHVPEPPRSASVDAPEDTSRAAPAVARVDGAREGGRAIHDVVVAPNFEPEEPPPAVVEERAVVVAVEPEPAPVIMPAKEHFVVAHDVAAHKHESASHRPEKASPRPVASHKASLEQVAFRRTVDGARIVLRTSRPVRWALVEESAEVVFLELEDTQILTSRNRLPLDTRFFKTAVARIVPSEEAALGKTTVAVELSSPARWTAFADGSQVVLEVSSRRSPTASVADEIW